MSATTVTTSVLLGDDRRRQRARERLYVFCQILGWGAFLVLQLFFARYFGTKQSPPESPFTTGSITVMNISQGFLLSHFSRPLLARWGWKELGWLALVPRVLGLAMGLSALWSLLGFGYIYGLLRMPWTGKYSMGIAFSTSWINGVILFVGWFCIYFWNIC